MKTLKELRNYIQKDPASVELLSQEGILAVLVRKLLVAPDSNQLYVLQVLAALGYLVQKSPERARVAVELGLLDAILAKLGSDVTSEGVLLLSIQVVSFLVDDADAHLERLVLGGGLAACVKILQRGCVRSNMLNARVAMLMARASDLWPLRAQQVTAELLSCVRGNLERIEALLLAPAAGESQSPGQSQQLLRALDNSCITLTQGLGLLLDKRPARSEALLLTGMGGLFMRVLALGHQLSSHLLETTCLTLTYALGGDGARASQLLSESFEDALCACITHVERLDESLVQALGTLISNASDALLAHGRVQQQLKQQQQQQEQQQQRQLQQQQSAALLSLPARCCAPTLQLQAGSVAGESAAHSSATEAAASQGLLHPTVNALRVLRRITKLGGPPVQHLTRSDGFSVYISLLRSDLPTAVRAEVLQELGLLVENSPAVGLVLAERGACEELRRIVQSGEATASELCNATRAIACFVEHGTAEGCRITDIALESGCDGCLIDVLCGESGEVAHEVLLNTVGALGYMVKRQSGTHQAGRPVRSARGHERAAPALVRLLGSGAIGESLTWNALWALIYLMNGACGEACTRAVSTSGGMQVFTSIITDNAANQPLVCSASKALWHIVMACEVEVLSSLPLPVRLKVLACATRTRLPPQQGSGSGSGAPASPTRRPRSGSSASTDSTASSTSTSPIGSSSGSAPMQSASYGTLEIAVDPGNITDSSLCVLKDLTGEQLRGNALKIQYVSEEVEQVGVDAGGVRRDWLSRLSAELFDPKFNLVIAGFNPNDSVQISPSPAFGGLNEEDQRSWYRLMGRVLGLSILYEDPLGVALVPSLCKLILEEQPSFEDVKHVSNEYFQTFSLLKTMRESDRKRFETSLDDLTFTVNSRECMMAEAFERGALQQLSDPMEEDELTRSASASSAASAGGACSLSACASPTPTHGDWLSSFEASPSLTTPSPGGGAMAGGASEEETNAIVQACKSLRDVAKQLAKARAEADRKLIRRLLGLQNKMLAARQEAREELEQPPQLQHLQQQLLLQQQLDGALDGRKRRLSASSISSDSFSNQASEGASKRLQVGAAKMHRMVSDLIDGGRMERIHAGNFDQYVDMLTFKLLVENVAPQVALLKQGFHDVLPREIVLRLLTPSELGTLIEGDRTINVQVWKHNTVTKGGDESDTPQLRWFWEYAAGLSTVERQKLLMWATGWRSIGSGGFANRSFTIELTNVTNAAENERLPSVATCGFHLWLPKYRSKEQLISKFKLAMSETSFGNC